MTEEDTFDKTTAEDLDAISEMLRLAGDLSVEAVWSFYYCAQSGGSIGECVIYAMREWDL